jgi:uncharacterized protein YuzE
MMIVSYDVEAGATYLELSDVPVARTVSVSDLVAVDVDETGSPVGVEFAVAPNKITDRMVERVADRFHTLKNLLHIEDWLLVRAY